MSAVTIRNLSSVTHRALKVRAALNNRSTEAEIRSILDEAVRTDAELGLGSLISAISAQHGVTNADVEALVEAMATLRRSPAEPLDLT